MKLDEFDSKMGKYIDCTDMPEQEQKMILHLRKLRCWVGRIKETPAHAPHAMVRLFLKLTRNYPYQRHSVS